MIYVFYLRGKKKHLLQKGLLSPALPSWSLPPPVTSPFVCCLPPQPNDIPEGGKGELRVAMGTGCLQEHANSSPCRLRISCHPQGAGLAAQIWGGEGAQATLGLPWTPSRQRRLGGQGCCVGRPSALFGTISVALEDGGGAGEGEGRRAFLGPWQAHLHPHPEF